MWATIPFPRGNPSVTVIADAEEILTHTFDERAFVFDLVVHRISPDIINRAFEIEGENVKIARDEPLLLVIECGEGFFRALAFHERHGFFKQCPCLPGRAPVGCMSGRGCGHDRRQGDDGSD